MAMKKESIFLIILLISGSIFALTGYGESSVVSITGIPCQHLSGSGESNEFAITDETLPVELSSFIAEQSGGSSVRLMWATQSETNLYGYRIYRSTNEELSQAQMLNILINATNTSQMQVYVYVDKEIYSPGIYYYWLEMIDINSVSQFKGPISVNVIIPEGNDEIPLITGIDSIYPNPFNPGTWLSYSLAEESKAILEIFNLKGQIVWNKVIPNQSAGRYKYFWDGKNQNGITCTSGLYFFRLTTNKTNYIAKMILMK
jgi:hypothetical protein